MEALKDANSQLAQLTARLRNVQIATRQELEISRHIFRGQPSYVVHDPVTFQSHELSVGDYQVFVELDGERSLSTVFEGLVARRVLESSREEDFYAFVVHLNQLGLLNLPVSDGKTLYNRFARRRAARLRSRIIGILFLQVPLCNPDAFLSRTVGLVAPLFTRAALALWLLCVAAGAYVVAAQWDDFCSPLGTMLALRNLPILWSLLVVLKLGHELGHAYACKHFGGHVPEMGAYFIVLTPCAYVDASAAWGFPSRTRRIIVSLAGMYFESILALIALAVWCTTEPSTLHSAAQFAVVLSTVVTVGFNINPLMRYDGYYILSDLVNVPNLRQVAGQHAVSILKQRLLGIPASPGARTRGGRAALCAFGMASACYKVLLIVGICGILALKIPVVGLGIGVSYVGATAWSIGTRFLRYVRYAEDVAPVRRRALAVTAVALLLCTASVLLIPTPGSIQTLGVVQQRDDRVVRATGTGFLRESKAVVGEEVSPEDVLCTLENFEITSALVRKAAEIAQLRAELYRSLLSDPIKAAANAQHLARAEREADDLRRLSEAQTVRSPIAGRITEAGGLEVVGRLVRKGEPLAKVSAGPWVVQAVANEETFSQSRLGLGEGVEVRLVGQAQSAFQGQVIRLARAGSRKIDAPSLTHLGGGSIAVAEQTLEAQEPFFQLTIALFDAGDAPLRHGMTGIAVLPGGRSPLALHLYRRTLQFLDRLRMAN
jgi:putative peptide zinc metalloprotease protein